VTYFPTGAGKREIGRFFRCRNSVAPRRLAISGALSLSTRVADPAVIVYYPEHEFVIPDALASLAQA
jgi:hypothetical protein